MTAYYIHEVTAGSLGEVKETKLAMNYPFRTEHDANVEINSARLRATGKAFVVRTYRFQEGN